VSAGLEAVAELRWHTPHGWADAVLADELALLADHAHLERAAAANAMSLVRRWPEGTDPDRWVGRLSGIARDEVDHLSLVSRTLADRGGRLPREHRNPYAAGLRQHVAVGTPGELADRLYVSALIELRSCERFALLGRTDHDLAGLYAGLQASEAGHHRVFVYLAAQAGGTEERWRWWCDREAEVARAQPPGPRIHAGPVGGGAG
jgi:tRNA-(ms[2]io[6]A)-hydroxylase